ncbi:MAG: TetR/AcrR family transcriptional regulator [Prevotellaceae bacterium]|jgi:AcrR family transcriptional regulator|nr:TetR/AcrR family transcriptional regulator [Prevotellaceae bacterium]
MTTKDRIIQDAVTLFATQGCKVVTMDDIATTIGVSKRTIYENFTDKEDLLRQCVKYFFGRGQEYVDLVLNSSDNVIDTILKTIQCRSTFFDTHVKDNFFNELHKYFPDVYESIVMSFRKQHLDSMQKLLKKGQSDGVFDKNIDTQVISVLIHEISYSFFRNNIFTTYGLEKQAAIPLFMYIMTRGICTKKGLDILDESKKEHKNV